MKGKQSKTLIKQFNIYRSDSEIMAKLNQIQFPPLYLKSNIIDFYFCNDAKKNLLEGDEEEQYDQIIQRYRDKLYEVIGARQTIHILGQINQAIENKLDLEIKSDQYRYQRLIYLKTFYDQLVDFILDLVQSFYYKNDVVLHKNGIFKNEIGDEIGHINLYNGSTLDQCIRKAVQVALPSKHAYEQQLEIDLPLDALANNVKNFL